MRLFSSLICLILLTFACGNDSDATAEVAPDALQGRWDLVSARRDNVKTGLLDGFYLDFREGGKLETNLLTGEAQSGTYTHSGDEIVTEGVEVPLTYEIQALEDDRLMLRSHYQDYLFDFEMQRAQAAPESR